MGKKKVLSEGELNEMVPQFANDVSGVATMLLGFYCAMVKCQDGRECLYGLCGRINRHVWIRIGDVVLVSPWTLNQIDEEICWRYTPSKAEVCLEETAVMSAIFCVEMDGY